jgi:O-antigen/teichoic acid export membrane protein
MSTVVSDRASIDGSESAAPGRLVTAVGFYGFCTALSRGAPLLYLPMLTSRLTLAEFGLFSLAQVLSYFLVPIISLNGAAAVEREGSVDIKAGAHLLTRFLVITAVVTALGALVVGALDRSEQGWVFFALLLAGTESLSLLALTWLRIQQHAWSYGILTILKVAGFAALLVIVPEWTLESVLVAQTAWYGALALAVSGWLLIRNWTSVSTVLLAAVLPYTIPLIPHSAAQWLMSSSDRFVLKAFSGDEAVGVYSVAYTLASVLMLLNSGLALALPPHFFRNYERWISGDLRSRYIRGYSALALSCVTLVLTMVEVDRRSLGMLRTYDARVPVIIGLVAAGIYLLGLYLLYTNILSYHRRTGKLAAATAVAAAFNIGATILFVALWGAVGGAVATAMSYLLYLVVTARAAHAVEARLTALRTNDVLVIAASAAAMAGLGLALGMVWQ